MGRATPIHLEGVSIVARGRVRREGEERRVVWLFVVLDDLQESLRGNDHAIERIRVRLIGRLRADIDEKWANVRHVPETYVINHPGNGAGCDRVSGVAVRAVTDIAAAMSERIGARNHPSRARAGGGARGLRLGPGLDQRWVGAVQSILVRTRIHRSLEPVRRIVLDGYANCEVSELVMVNIKQTADVAGVVSRPARVVPLPRGGNAIRKILVVFRQFADINLIRINIVNAAIVRDRDEQIREDRQSFQTGVTAGGCKSKNAVAISLADQPCGSDVAGRVGICVKGKVASAVQATTEVQDLERHLLVGQETRSSDEHGIAGLIVVPVRLHGGDAPEFGRRSVTGNASRCGRFERVALRIEGVDGPRGRERTCGVSKERPLEPLA